MRDTVVANIDRGVGGVKCPPFPLDDLARGVICVAEGEAILAAYSLLGVLVGASHEDDDTLRSLEGSGGNDEYALVVAHAVTPEQVAAAERLANAVKVLYVLGHS